MERKITIEEHVLYKEDYQMKMLKANSPEGFLHVGGRGVNGSSYYDYDVSGKVSMQAMYARAKLKAEDIRHFMEQLGNVLKEAERYLLDIHCILMDPEYIFYEEGRYYFCYYPLAKQDIWEKFHILTEYMVKVADYQEEECVRLAFLLHKETMEDNYSLEKLIAACEEKKKEEIFFDKQKKDHYMNHMFHGYDMDRTMLRIGAMNMMTHGIDNPIIEYRDSLSDQNEDKEKYSLVLANPPFKGSLDAESVAGDLLKVCKTKKTELLFLALFLRILRVGGRCACIVPDGVLFGSSKAHKAIRKEIVENQRLEAVISMPSGVFKPYAGVSTAILIFTKTEHGGTDNVWFYDMTADGFSLDDKRSPVEENDILDIIERFKNLDKETDRKRTEKSFMVPKKEIEENGYDLSINKYKEVEYIPVEYPPTSEIMANIRDIEKEISKEMDELEKLLGL